MTQPVRVIALMNQKGGVGKTTTTVNLAAAFARKGRKTLVIDLDPQSHASLHLGVGAEGAPPASTVYDVLLDEQSDPRASIHAVNDHLAVLPAETDLAGLEADLAGVPDSQKRLDRAIARLGGEYEFVLLDCPPSLGILTINGLAAAREVLIPMQAHFLALQGVGKLLETVRLVSSRVNPRLRVLGIALCMHDPSSTHVREVVADLESFFEAARAPGAPDTPWKLARVLRPAIRRNIKLAECPSFGQSIFDYAPDAPGAQDYANLAEPLIREWDTLLARRAQLAADAATGISPAGAPATGVV
jgi:chromosome partitioning protein